MEIVRPDMPEIGPKTAYRQLTGGSLLARNTILNLLGQGAPLVAAFFAIPMLVRGLGIDRFGVVTLAWMVIGYFSLFDLGTGRALTKFVAERLGAGQEDQIPGTVWTSLLLILILGFVGAVLLAILSPWLVRRVLNIPTALHAETLKAFYLLALSIPIVVATVGLRGVLEAAQRFGFVSGLRVASGIFTFLAPLFVLPFSKSLFVIVSVLAVGRLLVTLLHLSYCLRVIPVLRKGVALQWIEMAPVLCFGGWITVSNIISPIMTYVDRFLVAALISVAAVAYYVTPYSAVTTLLVVPGAVVGVLFPAFATTLPNDMNLARRLFARGVKYVFLAIFPVGLLIVVFARQGLGIWLGMGFAGHSTRVLQILAMGVLVNSLAQVPFALVQSAGRPDLTAKLHMIELPFYLVGVWWMTRTFGIEGTATVWSARAAIDCLVLFAMSRRALPKGSFGFRQAELPAGLALLVLGLGMVRKTLITNVAFVAVTMLVFVGTAWSLILDEAERSAVQNFVRRELRAGGRALGA